MAIARQTVVRHLPGAAKKVEDVLDRLEAHYATFPGYMFGFRYQPTDDAGEMGRIALWRSLADADHAAQQTHTIALRAELNSLIHEKHIERVLEIRGKPQKLLGL
ncbi:MAG: hypothetical protein HY535_03085 [Chloroflexi bacterium]|nr:hypothetical protein [Chloroflexota bacterium]